MTTLQLIEAAIATVSGISFVYGVSTATDSAPGIYACLASAAGFIILALIVSFSA